MQIYFDWTNLAVIFWCLKIRNASIAKHFDAGTGTKDYETANALRWLMRIVQERYSTRDSERGIIYRTYLYSYVHLQSLNMHFSARDKSQFKVFPFRLPYHWMTAFTLTQISQLIGEEHYNSGRVHFPTIDCDLSQVLTVGLQYRSSTGCLNGVLMGPEKGESTDSIKWMLLGNYSVWLFAFTSRSFLYLEYVHQKAYIRSDIST